MTERALSEVLGYMFVFTIILTTVAVVFGIGLSGLQDTRNYERVNNAQRAMDVLADNIEDVVQRGAPSRATEIKLTDATFEASSSTTITVTVVNASNTSQSFSPPSYELQTLAYDSETGSAVVYEAGAVFRESGDSTTVVRPPSLILSPERVVVPIVQPVGATSLSSSGSQTILIRSELESKQLAVSEQRSTYDVTLEIETPRADAWETSIETSTEASCTSSGSVVTCTQTDTERVSVAVSRLQISIE